MGVGGGRDGEMAWRQGQKKKYIHVHVHVGGIKGVRTLSAKEYK